MALDRKSYFEGLDTDGLLCKKCMHTNMYACARAHTHTRKTKGLCQALARLFSTHGEQRWLAICSPSPC